MSNAEEKIGVSTCRKIRMGADSWWGRGGYALVSFEYDRDAMIFEDIARRNSEIFEDVVGCDEDEVAAAKDDGRKILVFASSAFDGRIALTWDETVQLNDNSEEESLVYVARQMSVGWGVHGTMYKNREKVLTVSE